MLLHRAFSFIVLWVVVLGLAISQFNEGAFLLISCIGLVAQWEFYKLQELRGFHVYKRAGLFCGALLFLFAYLHLIEGVGSSAKWSSAELLVIIGAILGAVSRQLFDTDQDKPVLTIALTLLGFFYVPYLFAFVLKILVLKSIEVPGAGYPFIIYLVAVTKMTDVGAYLTGKFFGAHKLYPQISPKKTWEGLIGGLALALATSVGFVYVQPENLAPISGIHAWVLGLVIPVVSVIGDLGESLVKRAAQIKDSGVLIPGIGGALDLIDSILFTAPVFYCYLILFIGL